MNERHRGLGRGLGALIPTRPAPADGGADQLNGSVGLAPATALTDSTDGGSSRHARRDEGGARPVPDQAAGHTSAAGDVAYFTELAVTDIRPNPRQPRQVFDEDALAELAHSLREVGVLQPVVVRELPSADGHEAAAPAYELVMGERRLRAARAAGLETIPAIVRRTSDDALLRDALLENLHRAELNPLEEAAAYDQLLADFGCTHDELAQRIGRSRPQISNTLRLLKLPPDVQRRVAAGVLSAGHARALLAIDDVAAQERLAQRIVAEGLSVRSVEELVALGDLGPAERAPRRRHAPVAPALADLSARLSERFDTRVKVDLGRRKGKITIDFASIADLERIVGVLDPEAVPHVRSADDPPAEVVGAAEPADLSAGQRPDRVPAAVE